MIIKKLRSVSGGMFPGAEYNEKKVSEGVAELAGFANVSGNFIHTLQTLHSVGIDCGREVEEYLQGCSQTFGNTKSTRWQLHLALSCKGQEKSKEQLVDIAHAIMKDYGAGEQPYLIYFHNDTENNHVHILSTRVTPVGRLIQDHNDYRKLNAALNRVLEGEQKYDMSRIMGYNFTTEGQFMNIARGFNFKTGETESDDNTLTMYHGGVAVFAIDRQKLSDILAGRKCDERLKVQRDAAAKRLKAIIIKYREMSLAQVPPEGNGKLRSEAETKVRARSRKDLVKGRKAKIHPDVRKLVGANGMPLSDTEQYQLNWFMEQLHSKLGIAIHFQKDRNGVVRGYGIVDHNNKVALNGSDVMKLADIIGLKGKQTTQQAKNKQQAKTRQQAKAKTAKVYTGDSTLNIYRSIFAHEVFESGGRNHIRIAFADGSRYSHELSEEQYGWYSKAATGEEKNDVAVRLAAFFFPKQIYDAYRQQLLKDYVRQRSSSLKLHQGVNLRCCKHYNGEWYLETMGLRCNISYKLHSEEICRIYNLDRKSKEYANALREMFFNRYAKEEVDSLNRHLSYDASGICPKCTTSGSVNDVNAFISHHFNKLQMLARALAAPVPGGVNRDDEIDYSDWEVDDEHSFKRRMYM